MIELVVVLALLGLLLGCVAVTSLLSWELLLGGGSVLIVLGLVVGVPAGFWYHVLLRRALLRRNVLPDRWWLKPTSLHGSLLRVERPLVLGWCYVGAVGWGVSVLGCVLVAIGALRSR